MFRSLALSTMIALTTLPAAMPAAADGVLTLNLSPRNQQEADLLRLGLALYALYRHIDGGGTIQQFGRDNAAALAQGGGGNFGLIDQRGTGHTGTLDQQGGGNAFALFQRGKGTEAHVTQTGNGTGVTIQYGF